MSVQSILEDNKDKKNMSVDDLELTVQEILNNLTPIDVNVLTAEMAQMQVSTKENPTTFDINEGLALTQSYRDRLSEIYILAYENCAIRKRCLEMLIDANNFTSKATSVDKRKGEATLKYPMQFLNYEYASAFLKQVEQNLNNMKSKFDMFSRQGSMLTLQSNLGEYKANKSNDMQDLNWDVT